MKLKKDIVFFLIILICYGTFGHARASNQIDSLFTSFKTTSNDSTRWHTLIAINNTLSELENDTTFVIWDSFIEYCKQNNYEKNAIYCLYNKAKRLRKDGEYIEALHLFQEVLTFYDSRGDSVGMADVHNSLGILYSGIETYDLAIDHYIKSEQLFQQTKDTIRIGWIYLNLGGVYINQDSLTLAEHYLKKSEKLLLSKDSPNILNCYFNLGLLYNKKENYKNASWYLKRGYELSKTIGDERDKFTGPYLLGEFSLHQNGFSEAEPYLLQAQQLFEIPRIQKIVGVNDLSDFTKLLSDFYIQQGNYQTAHFFLSEHIKFERENKTNQANLELIRIQIDEEIEKRESERKARNLIIAITLAVLLTSLLFLLSVYRGYKHKKRANQLLTEMDNLKTQLYSNISHELRTPLTLILGPLEQMLESDENEKPSRQKIKLMRRNAKSILKLVNQMLDLSKIDAKSLKLELSEYDIVKFIKVRFANFSSLAKQKEISLNCYLPPDKKIRYFDASKLEKIMNNLLSNAIKFTPKSGQVFCFASFPKKNLLELTVQDTGEGIPNNEVAMIFDRFHQVTGSNSGKNVGTGIGLSLTKELVELLHGSINVESIVGEGTKFKVQLPLGKEHLHTDDYILIENNIATDHSQSEAVDEIGYTIKSEKGLEHEVKANSAQVLVVDDHYEISEFVKENLSIEYRVETALNGLTGLGKAIENIPDLIISDVMMPEMNGIEMTKRLKSDERTSHIPVILLTAKSKEEDKLEGLGTGADAFLAKPFSMKELNLRVRKLIEQRKKLREQFTNNLNLEPKDIAVTSADEKFINHLMEIVEENMSNTEFEVRHLQEKMLMSRMQLFRKTKALTNQTPGEFIRTIRLKRAARLIEQNFGNIAQITYEVGFNNPSYFAKCFKELFGKLPSEYLQKK